MSFSAISFTLRYCLYCSLLPPLFTLHYYLFTKKARGLAAADCRSVFQDIEPIESPYRRSLILPVGAIRPLPCSNSRPWRVATVSPLKFIYFRLIRETMIPIRAIIMKVTIYCSNMPYLLLLSKYSANSEIQEVSQNHCTNCCPELSHIRILPF